MKISETRASTAFGPNLRRALKVDTVPAGLLRDLRRALEGYRTAGDTGARAQQADALARLLKTARALHHEIRRTYAASQFEPRTSLQLHDSGWETSIEPAVRSLRASLDRTIAAVAEWIELDQPDPGAVGRPELERRNLRILTFRALEAHGVKVTKSARGPAAQALAVVFGEADRLDGTRPAVDHLEILPANRRFSGSRWSAWVDDWREFETLLQHWERTGRKRLGRRQI